MKKIKGILHMYGATGEVTRGQFIGYKSMDKEGRINNFKDVYDLEVKDTLKILDDNFIKDKFTLTTLTGLASINTLIILYKKEIEVEYTPHKKHKSWGDYAKK